MIWNGQYVNFCGQRWIIRQIIGLKVFLIRYVEGIPMEREVSFDQIQGAWLYAE